MVGESALAVLDGVKRLRVAKGSKVLEFDLSRDRPSNSTLLGLLLGRSGKLRAPTIRTGDSLLVGFNLELLESGLL